MSDVAIRCEGLAKRYEIGEREAYKTIRDVITDAVVAPFRRLRSAAQHSSNGNGSQDKPTIWALKDVSFEIKRGEVVGIIGRNGAGKSTLLKILSRITEPTEGRVEIWGRVGSLLEVGTGFHPELTGRDNIFLNGAILGMKRTEIARKFDEIVAFAEVEKFIDTPVKRYSSGMYVRLAFAVAAHLETEIIFVDEVLSVGDANFQKKCLGKMGDVARDGRTVLFVSHNTQTVTRLCQRCILLQGGTVLEDGPTHKVMNEYLLSGLSVTAAREWDIADAPGDEVVRLRALRARALDGTLSESFDIRQSVGIEMVFDVIAEGEEFTPNLHFFNEEGINLFISLDTDDTWRSRPRPVGRYTATAWIPGNFLAEGTCVIGAAITTLKSMKVRLYERDAIAFEVIDSTDGNSTRGEYTGHLPGVVRPLLNWETSFEPAPQEAVCFGEIVSGKKV
jgi:lipopolysaccharide transport system ATP-binding protein